MSPSNMMGLRAIQAASLILTLSSSTSLLITMTPVDAFGGVQSLGTRTAFTRYYARSNSNGRIDSSGRAFQITSPQQRNKHMNMHRSTSSTTTYVTSSTVRFASQNDSNNEDDDESDPLMNDQREGMADAFAALDSLSADDFDSYVSPTSASSIITIGDDDALTTSATGMGNLEESAKLFMDMQEELTNAGGDEGLYEDVMGDLDKEDFTSLGQALEGSADSELLSDADGIGSGDGSTLTTADVAKDILMQKVEPTLSMQDFMTSALTEAVDEIAAVDVDADDDDDDLSKLKSSKSTLDAAKAAEALLEDAELRREIEAIFDKAGDKLRMEVEAMKREQSAVTEDAKRRGLEYIKSEEQRLSEAEASVNRLIQKVARETEAVQEAMGDLERAKNEISEGGGASGIENTALDLKKGGIVKQAALVGGLLFGSRAFTETILVLGGSNGDGHVVPALAQAAIALACAGYFFLVK